MPLDRNQALALLESGDAWAEFCDALKAAGADLHREKAMRSPLDAAEGYRFMTRMLRSALELELPKDAAGEAAAAPAPAG